MPRQASRNAAGQTFVEFSARANYLNVRPGILKDLWGADKTVADVEAWLEKHPMSRRNQFVRKRKRAIWDRDRVRQCVEQYLTRAMAECELHSLTPDAKADFESWWRFIRREI